MTIRLEEVVRSEVEGGLSGPANPIPDESIDCGCKQFPCPKLTRFATRRFYVILICWIGVIQAASLVYLFMIGPTIARRFQLDPYLMDWMVASSDVVPFALGLLVAYWGDRIHRAAWLGGLTLLQSTAYIILIIPHFDNSLRVIEETENATHLSLYADDSPEICSAPSSKIIIEDESPCYVFLAVLIMFQIMVAMANIAYYSLGISYLDDNTKLRQVPVYIGVILSVKLMGGFFGYVLAWGSLRLDAENLRTVETYQEQIGAWWLGLPILAFLLFIPGIIISWFPRKLPSVVVEQAAASLLIQSGTLTRELRRFNSMKVGSPDFWPSFARLITNKILICNILASVISMTALLNFVAKENFILESRFHIPRPTGMLLGFNDPYPSRVVSNALKPVVIGLVIIISGLVISRGKPHARYIAGYNSIIVGVVAAIIFCLAFVSCNIRSVVGMDKGLLFLERECNKNCRCSQDADFRPVCDVSGKFTFYNPCYAGCTVLEYTGNVKRYSGCYCVQELTGARNFIANDGPCANNNCQPAWLTFQFMSILAYALMASTFVGDFLIILRSVYRQDKALSIGFWMTWLALCVHIAGKILYDVIANTTCEHWGNENSICHLYDSSSFANYLCFLSGAWLVASFFIRLLVWYFSRSLHIYIQLEPETQQVGRELEELIPQKPATTEESHKKSPSTFENEDERREVAAAAEERSVTVNDVIVEEENEREEVEKQTSEPRLKYGPVGPGDRRSGANRSMGRKSVKLAGRSKSLANETDYELDSSSDESKVSASPKVDYKPLDLDSDLESESSIVESNSRQGTQTGKEYDRGQSSTNDRKILKKREFPNPDDYEDPRLSRRSGVAVSLNPVLNEDGSWNTNSFEYAKKREEQEETKRGDFNEVGIPIDPYLEAVATGVIPADSTPERVVQSLIGRYEKNSSREAVDADQVSVKSNESTKSSMKGRLENKIGIPLVAMTSRPISRGQASSGFGSLADVRDKTETPLVDASSSPKNSSNKDGRKMICTDL
ncbi:solute carrier organic anion transporter family member 2B1 [Prorops nasuta]|uniref:solute carrier organic anion transporter family member 2B1 n=1 Tax=Prorops nasuta TaxID=863751 RepID=UPI0034CF599C